MSSEDSFDDSVQGSDGFESSMEESDRFDFSDEENELTVIPRTPPSSENRATRCLFGLSSSSLLKNGYSNAPNTSVNEFTTVSGPMQKAKSKKSAPSSSTSRSSGSSTPTNHPSIPKDKKSASEPSKLSSSKSSVFQSQMSDLLTEVKKTFKKLDDVTNRLDTVEKRLESLEQNSTPETTKPKIPPEVRYLVRDIYKTKLEMETEFDGFDTKKRYTHDANQDVVKILITEARSQDGTIPITQIKGAIRRFFQTKLEETALKEQGKYETKVQKQRRHNRITKKLENRLSALKKTNAITSDSKAKWMEILHKTFISSEESGEETIDGEARSLLYVKSLPWRASKVNRFMKQLDEKVKKNQSKRAKLQTLTRKPGPVSSRQKPTNEFGETFWGFA